MYRHYQQALIRRLQALLEAKYQITDAALVVEQPPRLELGEFALPLSFELARKLRKSPRAIASEIVAELNGSLDLLSGFAQFEVAGAGYINGRLNRTAAVAFAAADRGAAADRKHEQTEKHERVLVEHTSINPNKAAHVGHLRNAILGDTFVRLLQADGRQVSVQNYIDNTGVQVADIVVALMHLEGFRDTAAVRQKMAELEAANQRIDYYCWDVYARVSQWYDANGEKQGAAARRQLRLNTLHAIEAGGNAESEIAELISTAVLRRHLETMARLDIEYDFLPRESEILRLDFWAEAFDQLKQKKVLYFEETGKNAGCWVMLRASAAPSQEELSEKTDAAEASSEEAGPDQDAKVIVRSNGTVTYVGKDIAYHLWKFGLLDKEFGYLPFHKYFDGRECWISAEKGQPNHPLFGHAQAIYNVIDARQADPQTVVKQAIYEMGYIDAAAHYTHFSYEMVALTPRCAAELGYTVPEEDRARPYIEVSGRKGFGVKADDLIDRLIAAAKLEVDARHPEIAEAERIEIATIIAVGALRYFMLRFTKNSVIAFDFSDALSFEGETGPYAQYACVRAANIFRKAGVDPQTALAQLPDAQNIEGLLTSSGGDSIWEIWLTAGKLSLVLEQAIATTEPAYLAKYIFLLAQQFNNFYHRHHILNEEHPERKKLLLATAAIALREMQRALGWMGVKVPARM